MGRRFPRLIAGAAVLALFPTVAFAQTAELRTQLDGTRGERELVQEQLGEARQAEGDARARLAAVEAELAGAQADLDALEAALAEARERHAAATALALDARASLADVGAALEAAEADVVDKQERLDARVRAAFKYGQVSLAEALLGVEDIADFLNSSTYVAHVLRGDRELVDEVAGLLADVEEQRAAAQALRVTAEREAGLAAAAAAEVEASATEQQRLTALVRERRAEREEVFASLAEDRAALEGHLAGLEAESSRIQSQLAEIARQQAAVVAAAEAARQAEAEAARRAEQERLDREAARLCEQARATAEAAGVADVAAAPEVIEACGPAAVAETPDLDAGGGGTVSPGGWIRPVAGPLTSPYGPRWGRNHNGVDLGGSVGTPVVASRPGTVVFVSNGCHPTNSWGCGGGFGNYVTVAHEGGMATIYAHLASVSIGNGQQVAGGQSLGAIGNSGNSYGPHLHFETRLGGVPKNPCGFISC